MTTDRRPDDSARFRIIRTIGRGGMGVVYEAEDRGRGERVALKRLPTLTAEALTRFKREFRAVANLVHPNIVKHHELVHELGEWGFTMELIEGVDIAAWIEASGATPLVDDETRTARIARGTNGPLSPRPRRAPSMTEARIERMRLALLQLADALETLEQAGLVHRDLKPSNVLVTAPGRVVLIDFGIHVTTCNHSEASTGMILGSPRWMAPEQVQGAPLTASADRYAMGTLLYQALVGHAPFIGSHDAVMRAKLTIDPVRPSELVDGVPAELEALAMALLARDPGARPSIGRVRAVLAAVRHGGRPEWAPAAAEVPLLPRQAAEPELFLGRDHELAILRSAYRQVVSGEPATVVIVGESGMGKSALVGELLRQLEHESPPPLVFRGACRERESMPYKAIDDLVDGISVHLESIPLGKRQDLLPDHTDLLAEVFPALQRVHVTPWQGAGARDARDARELRALVFTALRELIGRLARQQPVVLSIDDLQWADPDGLAALAELLRPPRAPTVLVIVTTRARTRDHAGAALPEAFAAHARWIDLVGLPRDVARALAGALLGEDAAVADEVADEAGGHPLFVAELARWVRTRGMADPRHRLDEMIRERVLGLDGAIRTLLELTMVAGVPVTHRLLARAAGVEVRAVADAATILRAAALVRSGGVDADECIAPYHDRVRQAIVDGLDPAVLRAHHHRLARAYELEGAAAPEVLLTHWQAAGVPAAATRYAVMAARQAEVALAFDRAAELYRIALELSPRVGASALELVESLGEALANAGRGREAADAFLRAAELAPEATVQELRRRAADQMIRSGHLDEGLDLVGDVLRSAGMRMPATPRRALATLLWRRAAVRLRGLRFDERSADELSAATLRSIDLCWTAGTLLGLVDTIRGACLQTRHLQLALAAGEPARIGRAIAAEAAFSAASGGPARARTAKLVAAAESLARRVGTPYARGWSLASSGFAAALEGRWRAARRACERAETILQTGCAGVAWELDSLRWFLCWSLANLGELVELGDRVARHLHDAERRGDLYAATCFRTGLPNMVWLAAGDPFLAREHCQLARAQWSQRGFHVAHWWSLLAEAQIDLFEGRADDAYGRVTATWPELEHSLLLRVQLTRIEAWWLRGRAALACAAGRHGAARDHLREAERAAARIRREDAPWAGSLAALLTAGVWALRGDVATAAGSLSEAAFGCDAAGMRVHGAVARWAQGNLLGGDRGASLRSESEADLAAAGIQEVRGFIAMLAPGAALGRRC